MICQGFVIILLLIKFISSIQYNQLCTFSSGTCNWSVGRRWHIVALTDENKVLLADPQSKEDKRNGFTDTIMSSWLYLSSICSFDIRLTFEYSIQNENDFIEIYLSLKNQTKAYSLGKWKGLINNHDNESLEHNQTIWQYGNVSFKASEEFRIDIEIRHLPDKNNDSIVWFAIDDILIENCPNAIVNTTTSSTYPTTTTTTTSLIPSTIIISYSNESNSTVFDLSDWKLDNSSDPIYSSPYFRQNLLNLILYLLCSLIALTLLIILFIIIIFTYRKHCCPSSILNQRYQLGKNKPNNRIGIQIDNKNENKKTSNTTVQTCFE